MRLAQWLERLGGVDLREVSVGDCGAWSPARKTLMAALMVLLIVALGYGLLLQAPLSRLEQQQNAQAALKIEFEAKAAQAAQLDAYINQMRELQATLDTLREQLPTQAQVPGLLEDVSRLGVLAGLTIEKIHWLPEVSQPFHAELALRLTLVGGFHELGLFVSELARLPRIITLHDFALQPRVSQGSELRMNVLAKTYRAHDQGLLP